MLSESELEQLGAMVHILVERMVNEKLGEIRNGRVAVVADCATLGEPVIGTRAGPNGTQALVAVGWGTSKAPGRQRGST